MAEPCWNPGDQVVIRHVREGFVRYATPATIVQDTPERLVYFVEIGTPIIAMVGRFPRDLIGPHRRVERTWLDNRALHIITPGAAHDVVAFWRGYHEQFLGWYINLQEPLRRTHLGFDTMDQILDVTISPSLRNFRWKDEDEFQTAIDAGWYSPEEAAAIRAEGERAIARALALQSPFSDDWQRWTPPASFTVPPLPPAWDVVET